MFLLILLGFGAAGAGGYAARCALQPFKVCKACSGMGRHPTKRKAWRACEKCEGEGKRLRAGRAAFNWWRARRQEQRAATGRATSRRRPGGAQ